jgi:hypothetical protein
MAIRIRLIVMPLMPEAKYEATTSLLGITPHHGFLRYRGYSHWEALDVLSFWRLDFSLVPLVSLVRCSH